MKVLEHKVQSSCEWCDADDVECNILLYGDEKGMLICSKCLEVLRNFLVEIGVKEAEV